MPPFPEEQLDSPVGYFPARPGQTLDNGQWTIIRKLGWGPRSSTWLAKDGKPNVDRYGAIKVLTVAATRDSKGPNERDIILGPLRDKDTFPVIMSHFYEHDPQGKRHFCLVFGVLGTSVEDLRLSNIYDGEYLPVHTVQKVVGDISQRLAIVGDQRLIHGAVTADNFHFFCAQAAIDIQRELKKSPSKRAEMIQGSDGVTYPSVESQPFPHGCTWDTPATDIMYTSLYLTNYAHASSTGSAMNLHAPKTFHPPEALQGGKVTDKSDIWMLGCTTYLLLTGTPLFSDSYVASPVKTAKETLGNIKSLLIESGKIPEEHISDTVSFLRSCLAVKPTDRASAEEIIEDGWVKSGCACGWRGW